MMEKYLYLGDVVQTSDKRVGYVIDTYPDILIKVYNKDETFRCPWFLDNLDLYCSIYSFMVGDAVRFWQEWNDIGKILVVSQDYCIINIFGYNKKVPIRKVVHNTILDNRRKDYRLSVTNYQSSQYINGLKRRVYL